MQLWSSRAPGPGAYLKLPASPDDSREMASARAEIAWARQRPYTTGSSQSCLQGGKIKNNTIAEVQLLQHVELLQGSSLRDCLQCMQIVSCSLYGKIHAM